MISPEIRHKLCQFGVVPVVAIADPQTALPLADALLTGGLPVIEVTFRTAVAAEVIRKLCQERPELLVGAGTVITSENLRAAKTAGAHFAFAPGLNHDIVNEASDIGLPFIPGVATPSEIERALALGCKTMKFFPAESMGGIEMINALAGPYGPAGVSFIPTGGVNPKNLESYLLCKSVTAVGGSWIAKAEDLAAGNWQGIRQRCETVRKIVERLRSASTS